MNKVKSTLDYIVDYVNNDENWDFISINFPHIVFLTKEWGAENFMYEISLVHKNLIIDYPNSELDWIICNIVNLTDYFEVENELDADFLEAYRETICNFLDNSIMTIIEISEKEKRDDEEKRYDEENNDDRPKFWSPKYPNFL